jgi:hypothetical protein
VTNNCRGLPPGRHNQNTVWLSPFTHTYSFSSAAQKNIPTRKMTSIT